ncbi:MAG: septal ring lytic transglycosylase RlpA family protein [Candidatus Omnitrophota bacterium]|jgi:rare lipoprotein A
MTNAKRTLIVLTLLCFVLSIDIFSYAEGAQRPVVTKTLIGDASWYYGFMVAGNKFFRNGHYAAMWDVPLGTKARVTNLDNGKSIIVTINDRGPNKRLVAKGRIIDLAAKAFYDLNGNFKPATIRVRIELLQ